jgi:hypothetical protein
LLTGLTNAYPADAQPKTVGPTDASTSGTPTSTSK